MHGHEPVLSLKFGDLNKLVFCRKNFVTIMICIAPVATHGHSTSNFKRSAPFQYHLRSQKLLLRFINPITCMDFGGCRDIIT